jgi:hypothetical protein
MEDDLDFFLNGEEIKFAKVRAACMCCHRTKCPLLTVFFLFLYFSIFLSSPTLTFLQEGVIVGFRDFAWIFKSQKNKVWLKKIGGRNFFTLPSQTLALKNFR